MKVSASFFILLFLVVASATGIFFTSQGVQKENTPTKTRDVKGAETNTVPVQSVIDGDSLILADGTTVRLIGINAPEVNQPLYKEAKQKLETLVKDVQIRLEYDASKTHTNNRTLAYAYAGEIFINEELVKSGLAVVETILPNTVHENQFVSFQEQARATCSGIWQGLCNQTQSSCLQISSIHNPVSTLAKTAVLNDEWIEIMNTCSSAKSLDGYLIKDSSASNSYLFKDISLSPKQRVKLHSGCSTNSTQDVYWKCPEQDHAIWNNIGDSAYLYDKTGKLVSQMGY